MFASSCRLPLSPAPRVVGASSRFGVKALAFVARPRLLQHWLPHCSNRSNSKKRPATRHGCNKGRSCQTQQGTGALPLLPPAAAAAAFIAIVAAAAAVGLHVMICCICCCICCCCCIRCCCCRPCFITWRQSMQSLPREPFIWPSVAFSMTAVYVHPKP